MGSLCIIGVDNDRVLKDFIRAHVEHLRGPKVCLSHWYPDYVHEGRTVRFHYRTRPLYSKLRALLPNVVHRRWAARHQNTDPEIHDALTAFFRKHDVDVVLAEFGPAGAAIAPHLRRLGIPLIVHFHGHDAHRRSVVEPLLESYRQMFADAFAIITVSRFMTDTLIGMGADPDKVFTNHYGPREAYLEIDPDYESRTFLALGRFTDIKANYLTLMAFRRVLKAVPDARLIMVGGGELLEACRTLADVLGIQERVDFPGPVPHGENPSFFARACVFVQHSVTPSYGDAEGTPVAILEAMAAALPVVATRHAGIQDVVKHDTTGFLVAERDIEAMAKYMTHLAVDPEHCRKLGQNGRNRVRDEFSLDRHIACIQGQIDAARTHAGHQAAK